MTANSCQASLAPSARALSLVALLLAISSLQCSLALTHPPPTPTKKSPHPAPPKKETPQVLTPPSPRSKPSSPRPKPAPKPALPRPKPPTRRLRPPSPRPKPALPRPKPRPPPPKSVSTLSPPPPALRLSPPAPHPKPPTPRPRPPAPRPKPPSPRPKPPAPRSKPPAPRPKPPAPRPSPVAPRCTTMYDVLKKTPQASAFLRLVNQVPAVKLLLQDPKANYTLLTPRNQDAGEYSFPQLANLTVPDLAAALKWHLLKGALTMDQIMDKDYAYEFQRLAGRPLTISVFIGDDFDNNVSYQFVIFMEDGNFTPVSQQIDYDHLGVRACQSVVHMVDGIFDMP